MMYFFIDASALSEIKFEVLLCVKSNNTYCNNNVKLKSLNIKTNFVRTTPKSLFLVLFLRISHSF